MPFEKGHNHSTGRPKGSTNKISKEIREVSAMLLQGQLEALQDKLPTLKDSDYIKAIGLLMKHVLPAQKQIEVDTIQHPTEFMFSQLHIKKVKSISSGGRCTPLDDPMMLKGIINNVGYSINNESLVKRVKLLNAPF